ncbi:MAG: RICIN domain-containing protein [Oscillospiraceae bacterium]|nr:RICIN domain-containing protein [Oscillospiraceae bacterium]
MCSVKCASARVGSTKKWEIWNIGTVSNDFYETNNSSPITNYLKYCNWGMGGSSGEVIWVAAGEDVTTPTNAKLPETFTLSNSVPTVFPEWLPVYIQSCYSNCWINPSSSSSGAEVVQKNKAYGWNLVNVGDGSLYSYILTSDGRKAITLDKDANGSDLLLSEYKPGTVRQMWRLQKGDDGDYYFIVPRYAQSYNIDIEGPSKKDNAAIQVWQHNPSTMQFRWKIYMDKGEMA